MKKLSFSLIFTFFIFWIVSASNQKINVIDLELPQIQKEIKKEWFTYKRVNNQSCDTINKEVNQFLEKNKEYLIQRYTYFPERHILSTENLFSSIVAKSDVTKSNATDSIPEIKNSESPNSWFSRTNIQKEWVDEPEILKINESTLSYLNTEIDSWYNQKQSLILIDTKTKKLISKINIPSSVHIQNMFLYWKNILLLWDREIENKKKYISDSDSRTTIMMINVEDREKPRLSWVFDLWWYYTDARLIWNTLYTFWTQHFTQNEFNFLEKRWKKYEINTFDIKKYITNSLWLYTTKQWTLKVTWWELDCSKIDFFLPNEDVIQETWFDLTATVVWILNLDTIDLQQHIILWNSSERHITKDAIYLTQDSYSYNSKSYNSYSTIHKFERTKNWIEYKRSNIVTWSSKNWQYSLDEYQWKLRIITSQHKWTNIYVLDNDMNIVWWLEWIQQDEEFKSSRFFWDKVYLVTFKRTDPFFVIDLSKDQPKILWELKIPWYSKYLHEYEPEKNWKHRILWIWYDTHEEDNRVSNTWIKIDLYEIDYTKTPLWIKQLWTKTFWERWTYTPVVDNPRLFVFNKENKTINLPIHQTYLEKETNCYKEFNGKEKCYTYDTEKSLFFWSKLIEIQKNWTIKELWNIIWKKIAKEDKNVWFDLWTMIYSARTWFLWNVYFFISQFWYQDTSNTTISFK